MPPRHFRPPSAAARPDPAEHSGKIVAELVDVSKRFGDQVIIRDFSAIVQRGDRIGLIGPNGVGKTTLHQTHAGRIAARQR